MTDLIGKAAEWTRKRDRIRSRLDKGLPAKEEPVKPKQKNISIHGWKTWDDENDEGERHNTPYPNMASGIVWGMLERGHVLISIHSGEEVP